MVEPRSVSTKGSFRPLDKGNGFSVDLKIQIPLFAPAMRRCWQSNPQHVAKIRLVDGSNCFGACTVKLFTRRDVQLYATAY